METPASPESRSVPGHGVEGHSSTGVAEASLVARLRQGEEDAFETVVREYGGRLLTVARRFLRNEEDARDAVQEAFLSAFRALPTFEESSRLSTWLHRIVINASLMRLRSRKRKAEESIEDLLPRFVEDGHQAEPSVRWEASAETLLVRAETRALVRRSIDRLPETHRTVLLMRDIEELSTEECARLLGVTENAVKIRLHRARQALRGLLDPHLRRAVTS
ncbi:MAG: sigma-70 family RNA polymerase sigma factor [Acidobacteriota bacterium]